MNNQELDYLLSGTDALIRMGDIDTPYARAVRTVVTKMNDAGILESGGLWIRRMRWSLFTTFIGNVEIIVLDSKTLEVVVPRNSLFANEIYGGIKTNCTVDQLIGMVNCAKKEDGDFKHNFTKALYTHSKAVY